MPPKLTSSAANIDFTLLAQFIAWLLVTVILICFALWVYHITHFSHSDTSKGINDNLGEIRITLSDMNKKL